MREKNSNKNQNAKRDAHKTIAQENYSQYNRKYINRIIERE